MYTYKSVLNQELSCKPDKIIVEDTNSGYEYFEAISKEKNIVCESAGGKTKIFAMLEQLKAETESICRLLFHFLSAHL